jgi:hypothetical protein
MSNSPSHFTGTAVFKLIRGIIRIVRLRGCQFFIIHSHLYPISLPLTSAIKSSDVVRSPRLNEAASSASSGVRDRTRHHLS